MINTKPGVRSRRITAALVGLASTVVLLSACSGSSGPAAGSTSGRRDTAPSATTPAGTSATATSTPPLTTTASTTTASTTAASTTAASTMPAKPVAHCPVLPKVKKPSLLRPLACTSLATLGAAAKRLGLTTIANESSLAPNVKIRFYDQDSLKLPLRDPEVVVFYTDNGAVVQARCVGIAGRTLNPVLTICTDVGPSTRTDLSRVRAWALRAEKTIDAKPATILRLRSGHLYFVACSDSTFKPHTAGFVYQMQLFAQVGPGEFTAEQCKT